MTTLSIEDFNALCKVRITAYTSNTPNIPSSVHVKFEVKCLNNGRLGAFQEEQATVNVLNTVYTPSTI